MRRLTEEHKRKIGEGKINRKGFSYILALMIGTMCFFLGLALASPTTEVVKESMYNDNFNCTNSTTMMQQAVCTQLDIFPAILIGLLFGLAGAIIGGYL